MKTNSYEYLITMPSKFYFNDPWEIDSYPIDHICNPDGDREVHMQNVFWGFYGDKGWGNESSRYTRISKINELINSYGYSLNHIRENGITNEYVFIRLKVSTTALGNHLKIILDAIESDFIKMEEGCKTFIRGAKMVRHGWQNLNAVDLEDCKHIRSRLIQIMNDKDGSIVQVCCCSKCKDVFKRPVR